MSEQVVVSPQSLKGAAASPSVFRFQAVSGESLAAAAAMGTDMLALCRRGEVPAVEEVEVMIPLLLLLWLLPRSMVL